MVYGEADGHAGCNIFGVPNLLKIGSDRDGKIKKNVVKNVEGAKEYLGFHECVCQKYEYEAGIFQGQYFSLSKPYNTFPNDGAEKIVDQVIYYKKNSDFLNGKLEFLDHEKNSEGHEYLTSCAGHERKEIKQPVFLLENETFFLWNDRFVCGILEEPPKAGSKNKGADAKVHLGEIQ